MGSAADTYDALGRPAKQDETHKDTTTGVVQRTKGYTYDIFGGRVGLTNTPTVPSGNDPAGTSTYGHDPHGSVSLLLDSTGGAQAAYGYQPYGAKDDALSKGDDGTAFTPLNPYRYTNKRLDPTSGTLDMGARRFDPTTTRFLQLDLYQGALANLRLSIDPLTQNRYGLAGGNPISFVEVDGHFVIFNCGFKTDCGSDPSGERGRGTWGDVIRALGWQEGDYAFFDWNADSAYDSAGGEIAASTSMRKLALECGTTIRARHDGHKLGST